MLGLLRSAIAVVVFIRFPAGGVFGGYSEQLNNLKLREMMIDFAPVGLPRPMYCFAGAGRFIVCNLQTFRKMRR